MKKKRGMYFVLALVLAFTMSIPAIASANTSNTEGVQDKVTKIESIDDSNISLEQDLSSGSAKTTKVAGAVNVTGPGVLYVAGTAGSSFTITGPETINGYIYSSGYIFKEVKTAGTYSINNSDVTSLVYICGADRTISSGNTYYVGNFNSAYRYFKFTATKTGYVTVAGDSNLSGNITLLNSSKKAISDAGYYSGGSSFPYQTYLNYGVAKGKTYYFKVYGYGLYSTRGYYRIKYVNSGVSESSGSTKAKAKTMKKGKVKKGTITASSSKADWYKFKTTKKKNTVYFSAATNDKLKVSVYHKNGRLKYSRTVNCYRGGDGWKLKMSGNSLAKGIYYLKVQRGNTKSSGYYNLKWK